MFIFWRLYNIYIYLNLFVICFCEMMRFPLSDVSRNAFFQAAKREEQESLKEAWSADTRKLGNSKTETNENRMR